MKKYKSKINNELIKKFTPNYQLYDHNSDPENIDYFTVILNKIPIEAIISVAGFLSPDFIEYEGGVFFNLSHGYIKTKITKEDKEKYNNVFSINNDLLWFWVEEDERTEERDKKDEELMVALAYIIEHFWTLKLKQDFLGREFIFEVSDGLVDDFYGEYGVCLTFYEKV